MNGELRSRAEVLKLARLLRRQPEQLVYLEHVAHDDLRALREQVTDMLFAAHDATLRRLAASSKLLPVGLVAMLAQHAFGPVLSARIAGLLDPGARLTSPRSCRPSSSRTSRSSLTRGAPAT